MVHYLKHFQRLLDDLLNSDIGSGFNDLMNRLLAGSRREAEHRQRGNGFVGNFLLRTAHGRTARPCWFVAGHTHVKRNFVLQFHSR